MSGYTYASGVMTATVTARCPECNAVQSFPWAERYKGIYSLPPEKLCCSEKHAKVYKKKCRKALKAMRLDRGYKGLNKLNTRMANAGTINGGAFFVANTLFPYSS